MKILVISSNLIGDTILSTGVIEHFYNIYPSAKFTFLIGPKASQVYQNFPGLEEIIIIKKRKYNLHWFDMYSKCKNKKWDKIIDLRSSLLSYFFKTKKRYIFKKNNFLHHLEQLSNSFKIKTNQPHIYTNQYEEEKANQNIDKDFKYIVIFPGGNWNPKIWSVHNFNKLLIRIIKNNKKIKFIIVGSINEKAKYIKKIQKNISKEHFIDLMGESLTLTSAYMKKSNLFIGNDSGLMHLAAASNLTTIGLFGPTNDKIYGYSDHKNIVIRTKESYKYFQSIKINSNNSYMESITPEEVYGKIQKINFDE
ncbi:MAG: hypothetical protein CFH15_00915 [Alphaproteobacteria bacterium MarineAlpha5_Bin5]|nr:MAG: hypothetical protein CFH15_00915 [Alphaproteobacteria bacterium MarineAlpha5_Bin5]PPR52285.1 MAG: hypothetical protein CFH14_00482 [Alphaproteobacteria bacterium MarineAlpha5_Bin4]